MTWPRVALVCWVLLIVGVTGRVLIEPPRSHTVYPIYSTAAEHWLAGEDLYGYVDGIDVYRYHPTFAAVFTPWVGLSERAGGLLWRALGLAVFFAGLDRLRRDVLPAGLDGTRVGIYFLIPLPYALHSFNNAQANLLLIGLLMLGTADVAARRWNRASLWLAAAAVLKVYPVALGLLFCLLYPRRFAPRYLLALLAGSVLPFLMQSPEYVLEQYREWWEVSRLDDRLSVALERSTRDVYMFLRVYVIEPPRWLYRGVQLAAAGMIALTVRRASRRGFGERDVLTLTFHLACLWMVLLGPATESCTYTLLGPTMAAVWLIRPPAGRSVAVWRVLTTAGTLFTINTLGGAFPNEVRSMGLAMQPVAGLLLAGVVVWEARRFLGRPTA